MRLAERDAGAKRAVPLTLAIAGLLVASMPALAAGVDCLDTGPALSYWRPIREAASTSEQPTDQLAMELVACLGSPDRELRDRIAYELYTYWLRGDKLTDSTRRHLLIELSDYLGDAAPAATLHRSFAALILSELMRSDGLRPFMDEAEREALLDTAILALDEETDFRGLDPDLGWVHPVAHIADLLWRFGLHPATSARQGALILDAVRSKVAPTVVAYSFNEGDRLARVVSTLARRDLVSTDEMIAWTERFEVPQSMNTWTDAFLTRAGMAELHNTKQFLRALSDQLTGAEVDPAVSEAIDELVMAFTRLI